MGLNVLYLDYGQIKIRKSVISSCELTNENKQRKDVSFDNTSKILRPYEFKDVIKRSRKG